MEDGSFNNIKPSDLISYEGGPDNLLNDRLNDKSTRFSQKSQENLNKIDNNNPDNFKYYNLRNKYY